MTKLLRSKKKGLEDGQVHPEDLPSRSTDKGKKSRDDAHIEDPLEKSNERSESKESGVK